MCPPEILLCEQEASQLRFSGFRLEFSGLAKRRTPAPNVLDNLESITRCAFMHNIREHRPLALRQAA